jgi:hypothetical protein
MKYRLSILKYSLLVFLITSLFSCSNSQKSRIKYKPDVSDIKTEVEILRFDKDLAALDSSNIEQGLEKLQEKYGVFLKTYFVELLNDGRPLEMVEIAKGFLSIPETKQLFDSIQKTYPDLSFLEKDISEMQKYKIHYFGKAFFNFNKVYTFHSLYKYGAFALDNYAGIGLDFFLGENHIGYMAVETLRPQYRRRTLTKEHITAALAAAMADDIVNQSNKISGSHLLDAMIIEGKKFFVKASLMPLAADSVIYNFSNYQVEYCNKSEAGLWEHLGKENLLYSSKRSDFLKYITEGPFNPQINLPGNSASWLGAQIIFQNAARMRQEIKKANPGLSAREIDRRVMKAILEESEVQKFIQKYKPKK